MGCTNGVESTRCGHGNVGVCPWCMVRRKVDELRALRVAVKRYVDARPCYCAEIAGGHCESCRVFGEMVLELERGDHHAGAE